MTVDTSNYITHDAWQRVGTRPHHGVALPLSALRSKKSCGIGEFLDLLPLIDWCKKLKLDVIQLLPLNDSGSEPSPYSSLSSRALNPLYLSLHALPYLSEHSPLRKRLSEFKDLNEAPRIRYAEVLSYKLSWLRDYYAEHAKALNVGHEYANYIQENPWIEPYALFKVIKEKLENTSSQTWPKELLEISPEEYQRWKERFKEDLSFFMMLQYLCFLQMKKVKHHASSAGVLMKGDIPILINRDSVDVWRTPEVFDLSLSAGAPPDVYIKEGQYWSFPLFNWERMKSEDFSWWKRRLKYASNFYDIYRIDHVVGFFRIWAIPLGKLPEDGKFIPENEDQWVPQGKELLSMMVLSSPMLPIAEDLGTVPTQVRACLAELGICGTKVMRWERLWEENDQPFIPLEEYPVMSMTTVSTHDTETLTLWWEHYPEEAQDYAAFKNWSYASEITPEQIKEILWDSHHTSSLFHINLLQEYLALFPELISSDPEEERINIPGKVLPTNWTYRFRPFIEDMTAHKGLENAMREIL